MSKKKKLIVSSFILILLGTSLPFVGPSLYSKATNIYEKIQVLNQVIALINENYVEKVDWDDVLDGAFHGLLEKLDPHSAYIPKERIESINEVFHGKFNGIGIEFDILGGYITVISPIVGSPSDRAGLQPGDQIIEIEGISAYKITKDEVFKKLRGRKGTKVNITVRRRRLEKPFPVEIIRDEIPIRSVTVSFMIDDETGYIRLSRFSSTTGKEVRTSMESLLSEGMTQLIFDLRTNSGGYLSQAVEVVDQFITTEDTLVYTLGRRPDTREVYLANPQVGNEDFALIILVNRWSASASEIVSGAVQDLDRGIIAGETTFGKGLVQRQWMLNDGSALRVTISRYYTPSGRLIQRPYQNGTSAYYHELTDENREAILDSLMESAPAYATKSGRVVHGGGGIKPDLYISQSKYTTATSRIIGHSNRFTFNWGNDKASELRDRWSTLAEFKTEFQITDNMLEDFFGYVRDSNIEFDMEEVERDLDYLRNYLKAEIAGSLWGRQAFFQVHVAGDNQVKVAMESFDEAWAFLHHP